ncbi:hypothetical protein EK21DRAFT_89858 [Setomelanomma holmii]|uniref:Uncharacterized protein n=1 Tax=Setomelanomma holmii TaxID=210430 RepID=A0A9P4H8T3_9PLEO|nr:hypothetical protein EK21DRAFT_89858 [Setomelanomma holmii]
MAIVAGITCRDRGVAGNLWDFAERGRCYNALRRVAQTLLCEESAQRRGKACPGAPWKRMAGVFVGASSILSARLKKVRSSQGRLSTIATFRIRGRQKERTAIEAGASSSASLPSHAALARSTLSFRGPALPLGTTSEFKLHAGRGDLPCFWMNALTAARAKLLLVKEALNGVGRERSALDGGYRNGVEKEEPKGEKPFKDARGHRIGHCSRGQTPMSLALLGGQASNGPSKIREALEDTSPFGHLVEGLKRFESNTAEPSQASSLCRSLYRPNDHVFC